MSEQEYLMESEDEALRLDLKTDGGVVEEHARWAGLRPGMRAADLGCGSGKTTFHLNRLAQPGGSALGVDIAPQRIDFARTHYQADGLAPSGISAGRWRIWARSTSSGSGSCWSTTVARVLTSCATWPASFDPAARFA